MDQYFEQLPDEARFLAFPCDPALEIDDVDMVLERLRPLLAEFVAEGALTAAAAEVAVEGHAVLIAWCERGGGHGGELSGCRRDRLVQLLSAAGDAVGCDLLTAPPILVERNGEPALLTPAELRVELSAGTVTPASEAWDLRASTLAEWRRSPLRLDQVPSLAASLRRWQASRSSGRLATPGQQPTAGL